MTQYLDPYDLGDEVPAGEGEALLSEDWDFSLGQACSIDEQDECESCQ